MLAIGEIKSVVDYAKPARRHGHGGHPGSEANHA
jgi:hypothetical protein